MNNIEADWTKPHYGYDGRRSLKKPGNRRPKPMTHECSQVAPLAVMTEKLDSLEDVAKRQAHTSEKIMVALEKLATHTATLAAYEARLQKLETTCRMEERVRATEIKLEGVMVKVTGLAGGAAAVCAAIVNWLFR